MWLYFESALLAFKFDKVRDSARGSVELVNILIAIITINTLKNVFAQNAPKKKVKPKNDVILIHFTYSPE